MGAVLDTFYTSTYDYVDNPYWSAMQIKVKRFGQSKAFPIGDTDQGKVLLVCNVTAEDTYSDQTVE